MKEIGCVVRVERNEKKEKENKKRKCRDALSQIGTTWDQNENNREKNEQLCETADHSEDATRRLPSPKWEGEMSRTRVHDLSLGETGLTRPGITLSWLR